MLYMFLVSQPIIKISENALTVLHLLKYRLDEGLVLTVVSGPNGRHSVYC